ncbi:MAG: winged helix-turn-helix transcriptional regulator [Gammaproteobacteria bacterium]|nr:winged helix-turn-helix transcriptional regulator [Gammaproteobacteria bacterium]
MINQLPLDLKKFLPYRLSVLEQRISKTIAQKYTKQFGLSRIEWRVMSTLAMFEGISAKQICQFTRMEKMQVSRAINGLTQKQLINQKVSPNDQRINLLTLTGKGLSIYQLIVPLVVEEEKKIFETFNQKELQQFHQLINKLCLSLEP